IETNVNAGQAGQEKASDHEYILLPLMLSNSPLSSSSQSTNNKDADEVLGKGDDDLSERNGQEKEERASNKEDDQHVQDFRAELDNLLVQQKEGYANNTNRVSIVNPSVSAAGQGFANADDQERIDSSTQDVNTVGPSINTASENINTGRSKINTASPIPNDPSMQSLEATGIFDDAYDDREEVGAEADLKNLVTTMNVSSIPTTRIHKDHLTEQIIGDLHSAPLTRRMSQQNFKELGLVWTLVDLPKGKRAIGTKWVYRNKKDERGIVVRNKARLVAQGYTQEERIDYDEVFAPVASIEAIGLFLAYSSFMRLIVYQMDVKSAFLYGTFEEEVYVCQPPSFEDLQFFDKVYKVEKALYGLHQAPKAWYETLSTYLLENGYRRGTIDKTLFIKKDRGDILLVQVYVDDIIFGSTKKSYCVEFEQMMYKRFQMSSMGELTFFLGLQAPSTLIETNKAFLKDEEAEDVDVHLYRSMIGSLMYLTALRPDIMFVVCACTRFQVTPKVSHLHAVKRIFRYLKGQPKLGLWYPMDSPFDLEAFSDNDHAGASLDRKSTTRAEYVAAVNCCGQNPVFHSKTKHIEIRHHFIRDCYEKKLIQVIKIHTDHNVADLLTKAFDVSRIRVDTARHKLNTASIKYALTESPTIYVSLIEQFWQTASASTLENGDMEITATIDGKVKVVSEASIRRHLKLEDSDGISILPTSEIFEQLALMVETLESDLKQTKLTYGAAYTKLIMKVKKLEHKVKSSKARRRVRLVVLEDEDELEDPSKQGRKIAQIDEDEGITLV
ncbi:putative ribonuclease H-like domain-containing protein, partial [Tanacetum coccineum]